MSDQLALAPREAAAAHGKAHEKNTGEKRVTHKVRPGDTIWDISRVYKVSPEQIKAWNNLSHQVLRPGQTLTIHVQSRRS